MDYKLLNIDSSGEMDKSRLNMTLNNLANFIKIQSVNSVELSSPKDDDLSGNLLTIFIFYVFLVFFFLIYYFIRTIRKCMQLEKEGIQIINDDINKIEDPSIGSTSFVLIISYF